MGQKRGGQPEPWEEGGVGNDRAETNAPKEKYRKGQRMRPHPGHVVGLQLVEAG